MSRLPTKNVNYTGLRPLKHPRSLRSEIVAGSVLVWVQIVYLYVYLLTLTSGYSYS